MTPGPPFCHCHSIDIITWIPQASLSHSHSAVDPPPLLEKKGYKFKEQGAEWTVLEALEEGLTEYVAWKVRKGEGNRDSYREWVEAVQRKVRWQLDTKVHTVPTGKEAARKIKELHEAFVFVKEDRGPHNWAATCKQLYKYKRYVQGEGFEVTEEEEKDIVDRHQEKGALALCAHCALLFRPSSP